MTESMRLPESLKSKGYELTLRYPGSSIYKVHYHSKFIGEIRVSICCVCKKEGSSISYKPIDVYIDVLDGVNLPLDLFKRMLLFSSL